MNPLWFALQRFLKEDQFLAPLSAEKHTLLEELKNKKVAIVGNARSLSEQQFGSHIDACDVVIRMHAAPLPSTLSHGSKTTWLALGMPVPQSLIQERNPNRLLWMSKKRKRVRQRLALSSGFYLHPKQDWEELANQLNAPPTTGALLIALVAQSDASAIHLFGFDFFSSLSLSGRRTAAQVPHDFTAEKNFVNALCVSDTRVVLHTQSN